MKITKRTQENRSIKILSVFIRGPTSRDGAPDLQTGKMRWEVRLGEYMGKTPARPNLGGPLVPAGGLTFISAAFDNRLRVFDTTSGKVLWETELPAAAHATPMTYVWKGKQTSSSAQVVTENSAQS